MKVLDTELGKEIEVSDKDLPSVVTNPRYKIPNQEFEFEDAVGLRFTAKAQDFSKAISDGLKYIPKSQVEKEEKIAEAASKPLTAAGVGILRGITLGASDLALTKSGILNEEELKALEEGNPTITAISDVAGSIAPTLLTGGTGAAATVARLTPAAIVDYAGKGAARAAGKLLSQTTSEVAKKAIKLSAGSGVEGAFFGAGRLLTEDAMGDAEFNAESLIQNIGIGALSGSAVGLGSSLAFKGAQKAINSAATETLKKLNNFAESGDIGILKKFGAQKGDFKKLLKSASLDEKELVDYALDVTRGFGDTAEDILINQGITKKGGQSLFKTASSPLEEIAANNETVKEGAGKIINSALKDLDDEFAKSISDPAAGKMKPEDFVYGSDLASRIQTEVLDELEGVYSPRKAPIEKMVSELRELGAVRDEAGNIISIKPLSPSQLKAQSIEFGKLANWASTDDKGKQEVYKELRSFLENKLEEGMGKLEGGQAIIEKYRNGKKLYQKAVTLETMLQNGIARDYANNRGFSLTESILAGAGASVAGLPGAVAAYTLRKAQRDYGDIAASYVLRKIEKASNKSKIAISDAVDNFLRGGVKISNRLITGQDITQNELEKVEDKASFYGQDPVELVNNFVKNNEDVLNIAPKTAEGVQGGMLRAVEFLKSKIPPKKVDVFGDEQEISRSELLKFKNYVDAVENPYKVLQSMRSGYIAPEYMEAFGVVYPKISDSIRQEFAARMGEFKKLTEKQKAELSKILGIEARRAYTPQGMAVLQQVSAQGVQRDLQGAMGMPSKKVPVTGARNLEISQRSQSGLDRTLYRS